MPYNKLTVNQLLTSYTGKGSVIGGLPLPVCIQILLQLIAMPRERLPPVVKFILIS
jgi:hypothetical protein